MATSLPTSRSRRLDLVALGTVAVLAVAVATALTRLDDPPLWYDEVATAWASSLSWVRLDALLDVTDANLGPYYAALHVWRDLLGVADWTLRVPSAVGFVASVLLTARLGRRWLGAWPGLLAALLLAVHPFAVAYAHDARPYALVTATVLAATLLADRLRSGVGRRAVRWGAVLYVLVSCLSVTLHLYAVLVLGVVALALAPRGRRPLLRWAALHVPVALVTLVVLGISLQQRGQLAWVPPTTAVGVLGGAALLAGGGVALAATVAAVVLLLVRRGSTPLVRRTLVAVLVGPLVALALASLLAPTFVPRYLEPVVPFQCLALAGGLATLRGRVPRLVAAVAATAVLATGAVGVVRARYLHEDYRLASDELLHRAQPGDGVVWSDGSVRLGMSYYLPRRAALLSGGATLLPRDVLSLPGTQVQGFRLPHVSAPAAVRAEERFARIWVVSYAGRTLPSLAARFRCAPAAPRGGILLRLCTATTR